MEVVHIILGKANPNRMNGVNKVVNSLATAQKALGYKVSVWGITHNLEKNYPTRNYDTRLFKARKNPFILSRELKDAISLLSKDVVFHLHGGFIPTLFSVSKHIVRNNFSYVFTPHGAYNIIALRKNKIIKKVYLALFEKTLLKRADKIHLIGQSEVEATRKISGNSNLVLIPNGQNMPEEVYESKKGNSKGTFVLGFCGRIDIHTKGLDLLLEAFSSFHTQYPNSYLWIIGDDGEIKQLKEMARKKEIANAVVFHGKKFGNEKMELISQMDVFFHPSRNEGLPGAVLEAASMGVPCVVSKESNMADYIHKSRAGVALKENNVSFLVRAMSDLWTIKEKDNGKDLSQNAIEMIKREFNWTNIASRFLDQYASL